MKNVINKMIETGKETVIGFNNEFFFGEETISTEGVEHGWFTIGGTKIDRKEARELKTAGSPVVYCSTREESPIVTVYNI